MRCTLLVDEHPTAAPSSPQGAKLLHVSDLLLLGRATIEESLLLLHWLGKAGHERLGECCGWRAATRCRGGRCCCCGPDPAALLHAALTACHLR